MTLPLLISVPHAGLRVPREVEKQCILSEEEIIRDGDEGPAPFTIP
jgi:N-formylglutamate amidohydrolase